MCVCVRVCVCVRACIRACMRVWYERAFVYVLTLVLYIFDEPLNKSLLSFLRAMLQFAVRRVCEQHCDTVYRGVRVRPVARQPAVCRDIVPVV